MRSLKTNLSREYPELRSKISRAILIEMTLILYGTVSNFWKTNYYEVSCQTHVQYIINVKYMGCIQRHHLIKNADNDWGPPVIHGCAIKHILTYGAYLKIQHTNKS